MLNLESVAAFLAIATTGSFTGAARQLALLPTFFLEGARKKLTVLCIGAEAEGATLYLGYPEHLRTSARIRALTGWLQQAFGDPRYWARVS